jgi:hypothetical protein
MNGLQLKMDFEEFCGAAISIPQFEGSERWESQVNEAYEIFENAGNRVVMIEDLAKVKEIRSIYYNLGRYYVGLDSTK